MKVERFSPLIHTSARITKEATGVDLMAFMGRAKNR